MAPPVALRRFRDDRLSGRFSLLGALRLRRVSLWGFGSFGCSPQSTWSARTDWAISGTAELSEWSCARSPGTDELV